MEGAVGEVGGKINSQKNPQIRKDAIEKYREEFTRVLIKFLQQFWKVKTKRCFMPLLWIGGQQGARSGAERVHQEEVAKPREKKTPVAAKEAIKKESLSDDSNSSEEEVNKAPVVAKPVTKAFDEESVVEPRLTVECDIPAEEASEVSSTSLFKSERLKKEKVAEQLKELKELRERKKKKNSEQKID